MLLADDFKTRLTRVSLSALLLCAAINFTHVHFRDMMKEAKVELANSPLPDPQGIKRLSLGYDALIADLYWLAFIQYVGDTKSRSNDHFQQAYSYLDLITTLDPRFVEAYYFAAFTVGADYGRPDLADKLIHRGLRYNPGNWYLPFIAGINQYLYAHNDKAAAQYYRLAATYPAAPGWLSRQAEILDKEIPSVIKQINTWNNIYISTEPGQIQDKARQKLVSLWLQVLQQSPTPNIKARALKELHMLKVHPPE